MLPESRIQELIRQALAASAVSDPRGQIEMTILQAVREAAMAAYEDAENAAGENYRSPADSYIDDLDDSYNLGIKDATDAIRARRGAL